MLPAATSRAFDEQVDVLVVGGGPSGLACASFLLAASPELRGRVVVLEKERYPREKICAGAIGRLAELRLAEIGVSIDVPSVPVDGIHLSTADGATTRRVGAIGRVVRRVQFDAALMREARARGVRVHEGAKVAALERVHDGVLVRTGERTFKAEIGVGADGVGSVVRRALGLAFGELRAQVIEVDTEALPSDSPRDVLHFDLRERSLRGYAWDFPTLVDGELRMCRGVYRIGAEGDDRADVGAILDARLRAQGLSPHGRKKRFGERGVEPHRPFATERVLLIGEAAGIDPITGEGIAQAIEYGAVAAGYVAERLPARAFGFGDFAARLATSAVGVDLLFRSALFPFAYGRTRAFLERYLVQSPSIVDVCMAAFAGRLPEPGALFDATWRAWAHPARETLRLARRSAV